MRAIVRILTIIFHIFPIKQNKIFLLNFYGTTIGADSKALVMWGNRNNRTYDYVWGMKNRLYVKQAELKNVRFVKTRSFRGIYEILTSRVLFYNINPPTYLTFRKEQILINTWHGFPFKKIGKHWSLRIDETTCFISSSNKFTELALYDSFEYKNKILLCGLPRNDIFFSDAMKVVSRNVREKYGLSNKKISLYAPTYRGNSSASRAFSMQNDTEIDFSQLRSVLMKKFGGDWVIMYRLHPSLLLTHKVTANGVIDVSAHQDMQELLCAADVLITDYSSSMWDFSLMKKPVFIFADDIDEYEAERGFALPYDEWPYAIARSNLELQTNIEKYSEPDYLMKIESFFRSMTSYEDGQGAKAVFDYIEST